MLSSLKNRSDCLALASCATAAEVWSIATVVRSSKIDHYVGCCKNPSDPEDSNGKNTGKGQPPYRTKRVYNGSLPDHMLLAPNMGVRLIWGILTDNFTFGTHTLKLC